MFKRFHCLGQPIITLNSFSTVSKDRNDSFGSVDWLLVLTSPQTIEIILPDTIHAAIRKIKTKVLTLIFKIVLYNLLLFFYHNNKDI